MKEYGTKSVHVEDSGLFTELAILLSKSFDRVTYCSPWRNAFPSSMQTEVGEGIEGIERVSDIMEVIDDTDLFVFPDIYTGPTQIYLQDLGKRVWGCRDADELERFRIAAKHHFEKLGIPIGPYEAIKGIDKLRAYLQKRGKANLWIKIDETRGDSETFHSESYDLIKNKLDDLEFRLGPKAQITQFCVEDHLEDTVDLAIDTFCIDGNYPNITLLGMEEKGEAYLCSRKKMTQMPSELRATYEVLADTLAEYQYRSFLSLESRIGKKGTFLCDPCCRGGSPPLELQLDMIRNIPDILWRGADGEIVEPDIPSQYGVELIVHSEWADKNPLLVDFPEKMREKIKFRYNSEFDGQTWIMPQGAGARIAAVVDHGDDLDELIESVKEMAADIKGFQVENFSRAFPTALEKIEQLKQFGVSFKGD
jgi:hypothetical protein